MVITSSLHCHQDTHDPPAVVPHSSKILQVAEQAPLSSDYTIEWYICTKNVLDFIENAHYFGDLYVKNQPHLFDGLVRACFN